MEASRVDELVTRAIDEQVNEYRRWRQEAAALAARVERLEAAVGALRAELGPAVEDAARAGVAEEVERLSADLRRQISDLGRLIVNDLGRLPKLLTATPAPEGGSIDVRDAPPEAPGEPGVDLPYAESGGGERRGRFRRR